LSRDLAENYDSPFAELNRVNQEMARFLSRLRGMELSEVVSDLPFIHDDLKDPDTRDKYPIYTRLVMSGITEYVALTAPFGWRAVTIEKMDEYYIGATVSFAARPRSGFTAREKVGLRRINMPLMAALHIVTENFFVSGLMEAYLGSILGRAVRSGRIARGDVQWIYCALFYSNLLGSTELSQQLLPEDYVAAVNRYLDCVAGTVLEYGGEVLKFIGDGLLAIFSLRRLAADSEDMCVAAL
jgi:adenylate cyclase